MKKYACLLLFAIMLNGCDDGDLVAETINFADIIPESCDPETNQLIYKLKEQESLLLQLPEGTFPETAGTKELDITSSGGIRLVYRAFDGVIDKSNICDAIRPSTPNVSNEWFATGGKITIKSTANISTPAADGSTKITGLNHSISMKNITYSKPEGTQVGPDFFFGVLTTTDYNSPIVSFLSTNAGQCDKTQIYNWTVSSSMIISALDPLLILNVETTTAPRTSKITTTQNLVVFNNYRAAEITANYFCKTPRPTTPQIDETWNGVVGGEIEVVTSKLDATKYKHVITLKNVELNNGTLQFKLGTSFVFGEIITQ